MLVQPLPDKYGFILVVAIFSIDVKTGKLTFTGRRMPFDGSPICIVFLDV